MAVEMEAGEGVQDLVEGARADVVAVGPAAAEAELREEGVQEEMGWEERVAAMAVVKISVMEEARAMEAETEEEMGAAMALVEKVAETETLTVAVEAVNWDAETMAVAEGVARGEGVQNRNWTTEFDICLPPQAPGPLSQCRCSTPRACGRDAPTRCHSKNLPRRARDSRPGRCLRCGGPGGLSSCHSLEGCRGAWRELCGRLQNEPCHWNSGALQMYRSLRRCSRGRPR